MLARQVGAGKTRPELGENRGNIISNPLPPEGLKGRLHTDPALCDQEQGSWAEVESRGLSTGLAKSEHSVYH